MGKQLFLRWQRLLVAKSDWLAYGLGGLLVLQNAYMLPVPVEALGRLGFKTSCYGDEAWAYFPHCDSIVPTVYGVAQVALPAVLVLLGILIFLFKKKSLAQLGAVATLTQVAVLFSSYYSIFIPRTINLPQGTARLSAYMTQPYFEFLLVQLILAGICSWVLSGQSVLSRLAQPQFWIAKPSGKRLGLYMGVVGLVVVIVAGVELDSGMNHASSDKKLANSIGPMSQQILKSMAGVHSLSQSAAVSWGSSTEDAAKGAGLEYVGDKNQFQLCADFMTDQSHGSLAGRSELPPAYISKHPSGHVCFTYPVSDQQATKQDTQVDRVLVVAVRYSQVVPQHETLQIYGSTVGSDNNAFDTINPAGAQLYRQNGSAAMAPELVGKNVSLYREINLLNARTSMSKIVIDDAGNPDYCKIISVTGQEFAEPNPACPETVNDVTLLDSGPTYMNVRTSGGAPLEDDWLIINAPSVTDANGRAVGLSGLVSGRRADLVFSDGELKQIKILK